MANPGLSDADLRAALDAYTQTGSKKRAAELLGIHDKTYLNRYRRAVERFGTPEDPAITSAKAAVSTNMTPALVWAKTKDEAGNGFSVLLKPDALQDDHLERIREAFESMAPAAPVAPPAATMAALCTVYPLMDVHLGMHAWGRETGGPDYDLKLARDDIALAFGKIDALTPASDEAVLIIGGDFFMPMTTGRKPRRTSTSWTLTGGCSRSLTRGCAFSPAWWRVSWKSTAF